MLLRFHQPPEKKRKIPRLILPIISASSATLQSWKEKELQVAPYGRGKTARRATPPLISVETVQGYPQ
jgi:hypothetical protein